MTPGDNRPKIEKFVENNVFKALFRVGVPALLGLVSWLAAEQFSDIKSTLKTSVDKINEIQVSTQKISDLTDANTASLGALNTTMNSRFDAQGKRIDKIEDRVDDLQKRVYSIPKPTAP